MHIPVPIEAIKLGTLGLGRARGGAYLMCARDRGRVVHVSPSFSLSLSLAFALSVSLFSTVVVFGVVFGRQVWSWTRMTAVGEAAGQWWL